MKNWPFFFLLLSYFCSFSQEKLQEISYHRIEIDLDGKLDEDIWAKLPEYSNFKKFFPTDQITAEHQTKVKIFHNGKYLFIGANYLDAQPEHLINSLKRDDHFNTIVNSDAFGIVIDTYSKQQSGYYFCLNTRGALVDAIIEYSGNNYQINNSWNCNWEAKCSQYNAEKIFEIKIPLNAMNFDSKNRSWNLQFFMHDIKINSWSSLAPLTNNRRQFDLRYAVPFTIGHLDEIKNAVTTIIPSVTGIYAKDFILKKEQSAIRPSIDMQYNLTQSLRLDATVNPDFSQVDLDQQVINLSRFSVYFPERRNFFLEASDLFNNLGTSNVNPFYSRTIGSKTPIIAGLKLSGNLYSKMKIGLLNVQTNKKNEVLQENFSAIVIQNNLSNQLTSTAYFTNLQNRFDTKNNYFNRILGFNLNYISKDKTISGNFKSSKSFSLTPNQSNSFIFSGIEYNTRKVVIAASIEYLGEHYISDLGFTPRLYNYDAISRTTIRNGYIHNNSELMLIRFPKSKIIDFYRYLWLKNDLYLDSKGQLVEHNLFLNNAIFFKNSSRAFVNLYNDQINLKYTFEPLNNSIIMKGQYNNYYARIGYFSAINKNFNFQTNIQYGSYYEGRLFRYFMSSKYIVSSYFNVLADYELNALNLNALGMGNFHLFRLTTELFFTNRLNWTNYFQYNTQLNDVNFNSRLQWEYKPLSYIYLVATDNFNENLRQKNWGIALKVNYRLDL